MYAASWIPCVILDGMHITCMYRNVALPSASLDTGCRLSIVQSSSSLSDRHSPTRWFPSMGQQHDYAKVRLCFCGGVL